MPGESVEVDERTYARLVELASATGMPVDQYLARLVGIRPERGPAERAELARQTEEYLREHFGFNPTPEERAEFEARHAAIMADLKAQADRRRAHRASA